MAVGQSISYRPAARRFVLRTLGTLELFAHAEDGGDDFVVPASGKALALLAYVACSATRAVSRERLGELLWASSDIESALQSIRQARSSLKKLSGEELVILDGTALTLSDTVRTDRDEFRTLLTRDRLTDAIALYHGPFCDTFAAAGADEFERWAEVERAALRSMCAEAVSRLAMQALGEVRASEVLTLAMRLSEVDPDDERHWRLRLEGLLLKHDPFGIAVAVAECIGWLTSEEREPSRALRQLLERGAGLRDGGSEPRPLSDPPRRELHPDLIGREAQFAQLIGCWKKAGLGEASCVVLLGASGMGKTRLLADVQERLLAVRARVASIRALPADTGIRFALASRLAASLARMRGAAALSTHSASVLLGLNPALSAHFRGSQALAITADPLLSYIEALDELIGVVAEEHPLALLVDDLHWSDSESTRILASLGERQVNRTVLLVLAMRNRAVGTTHVPASSDVIRLDALTMDDTDALLASIARIKDAAEGNWRSLLHRTSAGSPLIILESLRLAMENDCLAITNEGWTIEDPIALSALLTRRSAMTDRLSRLDAGARQLALVLAAAGRPLADGPLRQEGLPSTTEASSALQRLELADVVGLGADGWVVAHDAVAETLIDAADPAGLCAARACAARVLRRHADPASLRGALQLFSALGQWDDCADVVTRLTQDEWAGRARPHAHASMTLASVGDEVARAEVRRRLPLRLRVPMRALMIGSLFTVVCLALSFAVWRVKARGAASQPTQLIVFNSLTGAASEARALSLDDVGWNPSQSLEISHAPKLPAWPSVGPEHLAFRNGDGLAVVTRNYSDSGGVDAALWYPDGHEVRITSSRGDDVPRSWAPDGSAILLETSRWGQLGHRAIATIDMKTHHVRRVSGGGSADETDANPVWSPDGTAIAFARHFYARRPGQLCIVDSDGQNETCEELNGRTVGEVAGWMDPRRILVWTDSSDVRRSEIVSLPDMSIQSLFPVGTQCSVSPDGAWLACVRGPDGPLTIAPTASPERARLVQRAEIRGFAGYAWRTPRVDDTAIDRLSITSPTELVPTGVGTQLSVEGTTRAGGHVALSRARWSLADSSLGVISQKGVLLPRRRGVFRVRVSAGGWRSGELVVRADDLPASIILTENWDVGAESRWRFFGAPRPIIVGDSLRRSFFNRGDGDHFSGAYLRTSLPAGRGVWVESMMSTPITATQWQTSFLLVNAVSDWGPIDRWDHHSGTLPGGAVAGCAFVYPTGEGYTAAKKVSPGGDISALLGFSIDSLSHGKWYRVLVQLLPDGRCGVAINGKLIDLSSVPKPLSGTAMVTLMGSSFGTMILIGKTVVGTGVRSDIRWNDLERDERSWEVRTFP